MTSLILKKFEDSVPFLQISFNIYFGEATPHAISIHATHGEGGFQKSDFQIYEGDLGLVISPFSKTFQFRAHL